MKAFLALSLFVLAVNAHHIPLGSGSYNASKLAKEEGYPTQTLYVETQDGYKLEITRIAGSKDERESVLEQLKQSGRIETEKPVVLLMHGIFGDSSEFVINSESSIAYLLADRGFDVFLGNFRGVRNSDDHHSRLNGHKDRAFWDYCFDDMGVKDLPSIINKVLGVSGQQKLYYIGFNQANSAVYVLLSQKPEYNNKIEKIVALAPLVYMENSKNPMMQIISENYQSSAWVSKWLGSHQFIPSDEFVSQITQKCLDKKGDENLCRNIYFLMNGFARNYPGTIATKFAQAYPSKTSTQELLHYAQLIKTNKFEPYYKNEDSEEYDLTKINVPVVLVSVPQDILADERDVDTLEKRLPKVEEHIKINDYNSNLDLILNSNARTNVYEKILKKLRKNQE
ncbi:lysosomal acid lipase/cholesteryl ester hydrolase-like [Onthophagus taurus]|uniref:lysosomal acid lipase/cholesteryl ester hydrolase-like n=1 Tax=Onthophagus taurus TaxID=166361 RepID=UPI0039BEAB9C